MNIAPLTVHIAASRTQAGKPFPASSSRNPQQNLNAITALLDKLCTQALAQGPQAYSAAARTRDAVNETVLEGSHGVTVDLPHDIVTELAQLGLTCRPSKESQAAPPFAAENKDSPELAHALAASRHVLREEPPPQQIEGVAVAVAKGPVGNSPLFDALKSGSAAEVTGFMRGMKASGLNPQQRAQVASARNAGGTPGLHAALWQGHDAAVTAYMEGLQGLGLNAQQIADIVGAKNPVGATGLPFAMNNGHAATVAAFMNGLKGLGLVHNRSLTSSQGGTRRASAA